jgi:hypothetical protein
MGSIVSQASRKCYREGEKRRKAGIERAVHGILVSPEPLRSRFSYDRLQDPAPTHVARSELNSTEEGQLRR